MKDREELIKEVFAQFGAAYYHSEVLHRGLCFVLALGTFDQAGDMTCPRFEEKLTFAFSLTLGQLLEKARELLSDDLQQQLVVALNKRNYLAHHFWYERNALMLSKQGLLEMQRELLELIDLFGGLDQAIMEYFKPKRRAMGFADELIQQAFDKLLTGEPDKPLITQRRLKKQEHVVKVWDVRVGDNGIAQIFETEDGCLWQFCDVGLGWTRFEQPAPNWVINKHLQKYLPANINPRPSMSEPWNYEFELARGVVLWVKRGKGERSYTWGVKA